MSWRSTMASSFLNYVRANLSHCARNRRAVSLYGRFVALALSLSLALGTSVTVAQLPSAQLFAVYPAGGQVGTTVNLKIASGADQEGVDKLHFSHPGITAKPKM